MRRRGLQLVVAVLAACLMASTAFAQGGGASTTGSISGKVSDTSNAVSGESNANHPPSHRTSGRPPRVP